MPSGELLKSQMLLPGWVVSEPGSGLEMQWGGDTCWRIFRGAFCLEGGASPAVEVVLFQGSREIFFRGLLS